MPPSISPEQRQLPPSVTAMTQSRHEFAGRADGGAIIALGTRSGWPMRSAYAAADALALFGALALAKVMVDFASGQALRPWSLQEMKLAIAGSCVWLCLALLRGMYRPVPSMPAREFASIGLSSCLTAFGCGMFATGFGLVSSQAATWLVASFLLAGALAVALRMFVRFACGSRGWWGVRVLVVGSGGVAAAAFRRLSKRQNSGLRPIGFVDDLDAVSKGDKVALHLGPLESLPHAVATARVSHAVLVLGGFESAESTRLLSNPHLGIRHWIVIPATDAVPSLWSETCDTAGFPALRTTNRLTSVACLTSKRLLDLAVIAVCIPVLFPVVSLLALLVWCSSPGPIFYAQERIGLHGRRFRAWKFRSMRQDADQVLARCLAEDAALHAEWLANHKLKSDPRVTWIGRILRKTSLDELPQLWNVLRCEMSLVGPRPIVAAEIEKYGEKYEHYMHVLPGITGLWQISGRNNTTYEERVEYDAWYVRNWSPWLDLYVLVCTVRVVLIGEGAY